MNQLAIDFARAARRGLLVRKGTVPDPNRHCNQVPLWEAV